MQGPRGVANSQRDASRSDISVRPVLHRAEDEQWRRIDENLRVAERNLRIIFPIIAITALFWILILVVVIHKKMG